MWKFKFSTIRWWSINVAAVLFLVPIFVHERFTVTETETLLIVGVCFSLLLSSCIAHELLKPRKKTFVA